MRSIEQVSLGLLALSLLFVGLVIAVVALDRYTTEPPIYKLQPRETMPTGAQLVRDATNLEGLKKVCRLWAERDDQLQKYVSAQNSQHLLLIREGITAMFLLVCIFSVGLSYIYLKARRTGNGQGDAL